MKHLLIYLIGLFCAFAPAYASSLKIACAGSDYKINIHVGPIQKVLDDKYLYGAETAEGSGVIERDQQQMGTVLDCSYRNLAETSVYCGWEWPEWERTYHDGFEKETDYYVYLSGESLSQGVLNFHGKTIANLSCSAMLGD